MDRNFIVKRYGVLCSFVHSLVHNNVCSASSVLLGFIKEVCFEIDIDYADVCDFSLLAVYVRDQLLADSESYGCLYDLINFLYDRKDELMKGGV